MLWGHAAEYIRARTNYGARVQHGPDRGLHVIADQRADLHQAGIDFTTRCPDPDIRVVVLEIAVGGERSEVHPHADVRVAHEAFVRFVRIAEYDGLFELPVDLAARPYSPSVVDSAQECRAAADVHGPGNAREA